MGNIRMKNVSLTVDPMISFNQAAFDTQYGAEAFNLSDYYEVGYSEGTGSLPVVPEPISSTLFIVGAAALGFRRLRKKITN